MCDADVDIKKINEHGTYLPYFGYSVISMCKLTPKLLELYDIVSTSPIAKYIQPLNVTTYHMTIYNIWSEHEEFYPYQTKWGKQPKRELNSMNKIMQPELFKIAEKIKKYDDLNLIEVRAMRIKEGKTHLKITVEVASAEQSLKLKDFRSWCYQNFDKSDSKLRFHITLGYFRTKRTEDLSSEYKKLELWILSNIPTMQVLVPTPMLFTTMENFIPFLEVYKENGSVKKIKREL